MSSKCCKTQNVQFGEYDDNSNSHHTSINDDETQSLLTTSSSIPANTETSEADISKKTLLGMVLVALGTGLFCTVGAIVQYHGGSVLELMLGRYIMQNLIAWVIWLFRRPPNCHSWYGDPPYRANIWARGVLYWLTTFCWWRGLEMVPLGDGEAILFLSPLLTVIAARLYLKEKLPKSFFFTVILTLAGLIFICQPEFIFSSTDSYQTMSWKGLLFLIGADLAWSGTCVLVRTAKNAHWLQMETVSTTQAVFIWTPMIILLNQLWWHSSGLVGGGWDFKASSFGIMAVIGALGFTALMLNVIGYQIGDATKVAWMEYLDLVFAFLYQWFAFGEVPNAWEFIGCACLLSTCAIHLTEEYLVYLKHRRSDGQQQSLETGDQSSVTTEDILFTGDDIQPLLHKKISRNAIDMSLENEMPDEIGDLNMNRKYNLAKDIFSGDASADSASDMEKKK